MSTDKTPFVSVIIPVYNQHPEYLRRCIESLEDQTYPSDSYEIIVVDNGSNIPVDSGQYSSPHSKFLGEPKVGAYAARNTGIRHAKGVILAFTDSDCIVFRGWLEKGVETLLLAGRPAAVVGKTQPSFQNPYKKSVVELYDGTMYANQQWNLLEDHYGGAANLFFSIEIFDEIGIFNEKVKTWGDVEFGQRVYAQGYPMLYSAEAFVMHPAAHSFRHIFFRTLSYAGGMHDLNRVRSPRAFLQRCYKILNRILGAPSLRVHEKLTVVLLEAVVQFIVYGELIRLKLGGTSRR